MIATLNLLATLWQGVPLPAPIPAHDALHYQVALVLADSGSALEATVTTRWRVGSRMPLAIDLDTVFVVTEATVAGEIVTPQRAGMRLLLPHHAGPGDTVTTVLRYAGHPADGLVQRGAGATRTIFADNWPDRARRWLAVADHPSDKATVAWDVETPADLTVVATGALTGIDSLPGGRLRWHFALEAPTPPHTLVVGAARLAVTALPPAQCRRECVPVSVYAYPEDSAFAVDGPFRRASAMIDFFAGRFGPFPYPLLRHVESSTRFGGMENSTAIFYDEKAYRGRTMDEGVVAHETAHQWFGDAVSQTSWSHLWLSEGFATYGAALWVEHVAGDSGLRAAMARAQRQILASAATQRPILDSTPDLMALLNTNNYQKGSWVLHTLRGLLGDDAFFTGLRAFVRAYAHRNAVSNDFARAMSLAAGRNLDWYFRQSLTQPGYPILEVSTARTTDGLQVTLRQVQDSTWGVYRLPGLQVLIDDLLQTVDVDGPVTTFTAPIPADRPGRVEVDPEGWWLLVTRPAAPGSGPT